MANEQKSMPFGTTEPGDDIVRVELNLTSATSASGTLISAYTAFNNAFGATPHVLGVNLLEGAKIGAFSAQPDATGVTLYAQCVKTGDFPVGTVVVVATMRGALA